MATLRVVLDTNVLLSGLAYPTSIPGKILAAWRQGAIEAWLSPYILEELRRVLPKLTHRHGLSTTEIDDLVDMFAILAELVEPDAVAAPELRDVKDRPVLGTLLAAQRAGHTDYLITGDRDLLALAPAHPIVTPADFWAAHGR